MECSGLKKKIYFFKLSLKIGEAFNFTSIFWHFCLNKSLTAVNKSLLWQKQSVCLPTGLHTLPVQFSRESSTRVGRPTSKASELVTCFGGVALEGGLKGGLGFLFCLNTFTFNFKVFGRSFYSKLLTTIHTHIHTPTAESTMQSDSQLVGIHSKSSLLRLVFPNKIIVHLVNTVIEYCQYSSPPIPPASDGDLCRSVVTCFSCPCGGNSLSCPTAD